MIQESALAGLMDAITRVVEVEFRANLIKMVLFQLPNRGGRMWLCDNLQCCGLLNKLENQNVLQQWFE
jgi:hypothetical protein